MKTISSLFAGCLIASGGFAQYGTIITPHPQSVQGVLSSARVTQLTPGYLTGYYYRTSANTPLEKDFIIEHSNPSGSYGPLPYFSNGYNIMYAPNCNSYTAQHNCHGVDAIEATYTANGDRYVIAGSFDKGVFFTTLNGSGAPGGTTHFWAYSSYFITKPRVIASAGTPGLYFMCAGRVGGGMLVARIDVVAGTIATAVYSGANLEPRDMIVSPYGNELVIVGLGTYTNLAADEGFFMRLSTYNLALIAPVKFYGDGYTGDEWFTAIQPAKSPLPGGMGYIVAGHESTGADKSWVLKLAPDGAVIWSKLVQSYIGGQASEFGDVVERLNPNNGKYEYYLASGTTAATDRLTVRKLDENGNPLGAPETEFSYPLVGDNTLYQKTQVAQIELVGNGAAGGDGFAAWTTDYASGNIVCVKAYFNGVSSTNPNCAETRWINKVGPGYGYTSSPPVTGSNIISSCGFYLALAGLSPVASGCWATGAVPNGSNARHTTASGIASKTEDGQGTGVFPNPSSDKLTVSFQAEEHETARIELRNVLGQLVGTAQVSPASAGTHTEELNLEALGIPYGMYVVEVIVGSNTSSYKIVYQDKQ